MDGLAVGIVVGRCRIRWQCGDRCGEGSRSISGPNGCWGAGIWTMIRSACVAITEIFSKWIVRANGTLSLV